MIDLRLIRANTPDLIAQLRQHCERDHYLHRYPDPRSLPFGYLLEYDQTLHAPDGRLWALLLFKKPQHHKQQGLFGYPDLPTAWQVLDLARVWIHPDLQQPGQNIFSRIVSLALRRVQWDWLGHHPPRFPSLPYHIELVISYADLRHHTGTSYRACSFTEHSRRADKALFIRRLNPPLRSWQPQRTYQIPLFEGIPIKHQ
jgi:hypothetical protein